jgi:hypothetical protein
MSLLKITDEQREIIRRDYRGTTESALKLAHRFGLTRWQVQYALESMRITRRWGDRYWTESEDNYLRANIEKLSVGQMSKRLKRSRSSIYSRAWRFKLSWKNHDGWYTLNEAAEILGNDQNKVRRWIEQGILKASYHYGVKPSQKGGYCWHIRREDLVAFIRRYPQELVGRNVDIIQIVEILVGLDAVNYERAV